MAETQTEIKTREDGQCYLAAIGGNAANVAAYLNRGADIEGLTRTGLLGEVARRGHIDVLRVLLNAGADVNYASGKSGEPAIYWAARDGRVDAMRFLLERGASLGDTPEQRYSLLAAACISGNVEAVTLLLAEGVDVNVRSRYESTALMRAATFGRVRVIEALLAAGADIDVVSAERGTALRCARRFGRAEAEAVLIQAGAREIRLAWWERLRDRLAMRLVRWTVDRTVPPNVTRRSP